MKRILVLSVLIASANAFSLDPKLKEEALKLVPKGEVVQESLHEIKVKNASNSVVEIEFDKGGKFEEASGKNVDLDEFIPENKSKPLKEVVALLKKNGKAPTGEWSYENSLLNGWYYEFEGYESGAKKEYVVDASTGNIIETKNDDD